MFDTGLKMKRSVSDIEAGIKLIEKDIAGNREVNVQVKQAQKDVVKLFKELKILTMLNSKSGIIIPIINFFIINIAVHSASPGSEKIEFSLTMLVALVVAIILANIFMAKAVKAWVIKRSTDIEDKLNKKEIEIKTLI